MITCLPEPEQITAPPQLTPQRQPQTLGRTALPSDIDNKYSAIPANWRGFFCLNSKDFLDIGEYKEECIHRVHGFACRFRSVAAYLEAHMARPKCHHAPA